MNINYLKYALEVEKSHSINKAAEKLFMGQPNLSRAIRELEESIGITIFNRTPQGMTVTEEGEEFLQYARKILRQIDEVEAIYAHGKGRKQSFSASVPRAAYISYAFARFSASISPEKPSELLYKETNSARTISNLLTADYNLGIIRNAAEYDRYFREQLKGKRLARQLLTEFTYVQVFSENHPLAQKENITFDDLQPYTEIAHADPYVPTLSMAAVRKEELPDNVHKRIFIFERASQFDLLSMTPGTFMWMSPLPEELLKIYRLVQRRLDCNTRVYRDVLIHKEEYRLSALDHRFVNEVLRAKEEILDPVYRGM